MRLPAFLLLAALPLAPAWAKDPPRTLFISPMGEPFRTGDGAPEAAWFRGVDKDGDGKLTLTEFTLDAARFFALLDTDHDGSLSAEEIRRYESEIAPEVRSRGFGEGFGGKAARNGPTMAWVAACGAADTEAAWAVEAASAAAIAAGAECGAAAAYAAPLEGAGRYGYIDTPEPVTAADIDLSGIVTRAEFLSAAGRRFELLDANRDGSIGERELPRLKVNPHRERPASDQRPSGDEAQDDGF